MLLALAEDILGAGAIERRGAFEERCPSITGDDADHLQRHLFHCGAKSFETQQADAIDVRERHG